MRRRQGFSWHSGVVRARNRDAPGLQPRGWWLAAAPDASPLSLADDDHYILRFGSPDRSGGLMSSDPGMFASISLPVVITTLRGVPCLGQAAGAEGPGTPPPLMQYLPLVAIAAAAYLLLFRPERERVKKQQDLLGGLKKNDRVVTSSGIYGTVASVDREADRVILKVDESSNAKLTVTLSSVARILRDGAGGGQDDGSGG